MTVAFEELKRAIVAERELFADSLESAGEGAETLAGEWTAGDVAAHVVSLDRVWGVPTFIGRSIVARTALRLNDAAGRFADAGLRGSRRKGFAWCVAKLREDPPRLLVRPLVAPIGLFEVYVHHEDVRRPAGLPLRAAPPELAAGIRWAARYQLKRLAGLSVVIEVDDVDGDVRVGAGAEVRVRGPLGEVMLWLAGRRGAAAVDLDGDGDAVAAARDAPLAV